MANKFDGDVRPLSNGPRYMGVVFQGTLDEALAQAKAMPDHGMAGQVTPRGASRSRGALLEHLNLLNGVGIDFARGPSREDDSVEYGAPDADDALLVELFDQPKHSRFSLEYAMARWPDSFKS